MSAINNSINNTSYSFSTTAGLTVGNHAEVTLGGLTVVAGDTILTPIAGTNGGVVLSSTAGLISHVENPTTNGQLLISKSDGTNPIWASITPGTGISVTPGANSITIAATAAGITWSEVTADVTPIVVDNGYITNKAGSACALTLPTTAAVGDLFEIVGKGATGWTVVQASGQLIRLGSAVTTTGATGHLDSGNQYDCVSLVCTVANTTWTVKSSVGNLTLA
jgi:hypothetical protein